MQMFCMRCGTRLENGKCPNCGNENITPVQTVLHQENNVPVYPAPIENAVHKKRQKEKRYKEKRYKEPWAKKKKMTLILILSVSFVIVLGAGAFITYYFLSDAKYQEAMSYLESGKPKLAAEEFEELKSFKESEKYLEDANTMIAYNEAVDTYKKHNYAEALTCFEALGTYEDSKSYVQLCQNYLEYNKANAYFAAGNFEQSKAIFVALGDFEDSIEMTVSCQNNLDYIEADGYFDAAEYEEAKRIFAIIPGFKDADDKLYISESIIRFNDAVDTYEKGSYESALKEFKELEYIVVGSEVDFTELLKKDQLKYYQGQCCYKLKLYYSAYQAFNAAAGYEDSSIMAGRCIQPFETKEVFIDPNYTKNSVKFIFKGAKATENTCVKIYRGSTLVSVCLIEKGKKLTIHLPTGEFSFEIYYGTMWFGTEEGFGNHGYDDYYADKLSSSYYYWIDL